MGKRMIFNKNFFSKILIGTLFISTLLIIRFWEEKLRFYSGGRGLLDMQFGYNADAVYTMFSNLGTLGRRLYVRLLAIDCIFILSFALVQLNMSKRILGQTNEVSNWRFFILFIYLRALFDIMENMTLLSLLIKFPGRLNNLVEISSLATMLKFIFLGLWLIMIPIIIIKRNRKKVIL